MTTPTDQELKEFLARQLPEKLTLYNNPSTKVATLFWNNNDPRFVESVKETEWLQIVQWVENNLNESQWLNHGTAIVELYPYTNDKTYFQWTLSLTWQQRAIVLKLYVTPTETLYRV